jgi:redox-sensitive bicupin YhaK (pirin superfamily)
MGFGTHPHDNMEIVTIVLEGELQHRDSMGNGSVIRAGEVQVMSAGTGIKHSEFNNSEKDQVKLLQIWVFPESQNLEPRYGQAKYSEEEMDGKWCRLVSPHGAGKSLWIHQQAWFSMGEFEASSSVNYELNSAGSGVYLFLISGELEVGDEKLNKRDAVCIEEIQRQVKLKISQPSKILVVEVPV